MLLVDIRVTTMRFFWEIFCFDSCFLIPHFSDKANPACKLDNMLSVALPWILLLWGGRNPGFLRLLDAIPQLCCLSAEGHFWILVLALRLSIVSVSPSQVSSNYFTKPGNFHWQFVLPVRSIFPSPSARHSPFFTKVGKRRGACKDEPCNAHLQQYSNSSKLCPLVKMMTIFMNLKQLFQLLFPVHLRLEE